MFESLEILNWYFRQLIGEYKCTNLLLAPSFSAAIQLLDSFDNVEFEHVPRESN